jgi:3-oxoacyl-(acyl-carrier-protein) synthase
VKTQTNQEFNNQQLMKVSEVVKHVVEKELGQMRAMKENNDDSRFNESQNVDNFDQENFINTLSDGFTQIISLSNP